MSKHEDIVKEATELAELTESACTTTNGAEEFLKTYAEK